MACETRAAQSREPRCAETPQARPPRAGRGRTPGATEGTDERWPASAQSARLGAAGAPSARPARSPAAPASLLDRCRFCCRACSVASLLFLPSSLAAIQRMPGPGSRPGTRGSAPPGPGGLPGAPAGGQRGRLSAIARSAAQPQARVLLLRRRAAAAGLGEERELSAQQVVPGLVGLLVDLNSSHAALRPSGAEPLEGLPTARAACRGSRTRCSPAQEPPGLRHSRARAVQAQKEVKPFLTLVAAPAACTRSTLNLTVLDSGLRASRLLSADHVHGDGTAAHPGA